MKKIIKTALLIAITASIASYASSVAFNGAPTGEWHEECQYPTRPLRYGNCDNSDPADPENVNVGIVKEYQKKKKPKVVAPKTPKSVCGGIQ